VPAKFKLLKGFVHQGFVISPLNTIVLSHHELFGQYGLIKRRQRPVRAGVAVDTLADLNLGDYVVHAGYGIGKFQGIETIKEKAGANEYLTLGFANDAKIQVSVRNIALVQKYIGTSPKRPKLSKVGYPERTAYITDTTPENNMDWWFSGLYWFVLNYVHSGRVNMLYVDGHVDGLEGDEAIGYPFNLRNNVVP